MKQAMDIGSQRYVDWFTERYLDTLLWLGQQKGGALAGIRRLDLWYTRDDLQPHTIAATRRMCAEFVAGNRADLAGMDADEAGYGLAMSRNLGESRFPVSSRSRSAVRLGTAACALGQHWLKLDSDIAPFDPYTSRTAFAPHGRGTDDPDLPNTEDEIAPQLRALFGSAGLLPDDIHARAQQYLHQQPGWGPSTTLRRACDEIEGTGVYQRVAARFSPETDPRHEDIAYQNAVLDTDAYRWAPSHSGEALTDRDHPAPDTTATAPSAVGGAVRLRTVGRTDMDLGVGNTIHRPDMGAHDTDPWRAPPARAWTVNTAGSRLARGFSEHQMRVELNHRYGQLVPQSATRDEVAAVWAAHTATNPATRQRITTENPSATEWQQGWVRYAHRYERLGEMVDYASIQRARAHRADHPALTFAAALRHVYDETEGLGAFANMIRRAGLEQNFADGDLEYARNTIASLFEHGYCHALAVTLHHRYQWPLVAVRNELGDDDHYLARARDGRLVDVAGAHTDETVIHAWANSQPHVYRIADLALADIEDKIQRGRLARPQTVALLADHVADTVLALDPTLNEPFTEQRGSTSEMQLALGHNQDMINSYDSHIQGGHDVGQAAYLATINHTDTIANSDTAAGNGLLKLQHSGRTIEHYHALRQTGADHRTARTHAAQTSAAQTSGARAMGTLRSTAPTDALLGSAVETGATTVGTDRHPVGHHGHPAHGPHGALDVAAASLEQRAVGAQIVSPKDGIAGAEAVETGRPALAADPVGAAGEVAATGTLDRALYDEPLRAQLGGGADRVGEHDGNVAGSGLS